MKQKRIDKFDAGYLTGIPGIDAQHKDLVFMASTFLDSLEKGNVAEKAGISSLEEIVGAVKIHFSTEESLMDMIGFPRFAEHKEEHKRLVDLYVDEIKKLKNSGKAGLELFAQNFLDAELKHISEFDKEYASHIENLMALRKKFNISALKARVLAE